MHGVEILQEILLMVGVTKMFQVQLVQILLQKKLVMILLIAGGRQAIGMTQVQEELAQLQTGEVEDILTEA